MDYVYALTRCVRRWELNDDAVLAIAAFAGVSMGLIAKFWGLPE
jgi:hypothetical protein